MFRRSVGVVSRGATMTLQSSVPTLVPRLKSRSFFSQAKQEVPKIVQSELPEPPFGPDVIEPFNNEIFRTPFKGDVKVPFLYTSPRQRQDATDRVKSMQNPILTNLEAKIATAEAEKKPYYLVDLPQTPKLSPIPHLLYDGDTDEVSLPLPVIPETQNGAPTLRTIIAPKEDIKVLERERIDGLNYLNWTPTRLREEKIADLAVCRCLNMINQRLEDPALYANLGLPDNHSSRQALTALHMWLYMHGLQYRQLALMDHYKANFFIRFDLQLGDRMIEQAKSRRRVSKVLEMHLPAVRLEFVVMDKAIQSFIGGDPEPLYGALYRYLYRYSEQDKLTRRSKEEAKKGIVTAHHVTMDNPVDMAHLNTCVQYIMNQLYFLATATPRDFYLHVSGYTDFVPVPAAPSKMLGPLNKAEMTRFSYPICNAIGEPTPMQRAINLAVTRFFGNGDRAALVMQPTDGPAHRPPSFMYTRTEQEHHKKN